MVFAYDGGAPGAAAPASSCASTGRAWPPAASRPPRRTTSAFDETFNVGVDRGTPVTDDYPPVRNDFTGAIREVRVDLGPQTHLDEDATRTVALKTAD